MLIDSSKVYDDDPNELSRFGLNSNGITYIYPTALPSLHEQARFAQAVRDCKDAKRCIVSLDDVYTSVLVEPSQLVHHGYLGKQSGIISSSGLRSNTNPIILSNKNMDLYQSRCHPVRDLGLAFPFPRLVQPAELSRREHELYHMPDSDEESIELPEGYLNGPAFSVSGMIHESAIEGLHNATGSTGSVISYSHIKNSSSKAVNYVVDI